MSQKPLIVVSGATGAQGGSVANSLLATGNYRVRALTRNPNSDKAKKLASKGAEVFKCDLSIREDVEKALSGADIAWLVTNFWDPSISGTDVNEEERQGKMFADIAKEKGLNWLIFSSLPESTVESGGKYPDITLFSGKYHVEEYIKASGIPNSTFVYLGFYFQNFGSPSFIPFVPNENGEIELVVPYLEESDKLPMVDAENDTGPLVAKIIEEGPTKWNGRQVPVAAENVSFKHLIDVLTKVTGKKHKLKTLSDDDIAKSYSNAYSEPLKQMFKFNKDLGVFGKSDQLQDISISKELNPTIKTFEQYAYETYGKAK
ncbi:hypothetical protein RclHR1_02090010 [Rhizophagus clarus]|uniref:NmrA-like family domain-containing protein 1 n=1 Tax=Rhizophagus clarus TaxID=94130 RepID=A0A2Z6RKT9_9GLOM|nr:hypothetical protein RclHR1_02090010 [Rhizophagus clarus]GES87715.1 NmrA-like family domain-containing protein 1 [Rhizophagus clarus]